MTNDEGRRKLECSNDEKSRSRFLYHSDFVIPSSLEHSSSVISFTLLSLQGASVSCPICQSPFSFRRFAPSSSAIRKPDRLLSSAWGLSSVSLRFLSRRLPLFPRSLPLALPGSRPCTFPGSILSSCYR